MSRFLCYTSDSREVTANVLSGQGSLHLSPELVPESVFHCIDVNLCGDSNKRFDRCQTTEHSCILSKPTSWHAVPEFICLLVFQRSSRMLVCLKDGCAKTTVHPSTWRQKVQTKLTISPSLIILTLGQPAPALTLWCCAPVREAPRMPASESDPFMDVS